MDYLRLAIDIVSCFSDLALAYFLYSSFGEKKFSKLKRSGLFCAIWVVYVVVISVVGNSAFLLISSIFLSYAVTLCFQMKQSFRIILTLVISAIASFAEYIPFLAINLLLENNQNVLQGNLFLYFIGVAISKFFVYLIVLIIRQGKHRSITLSGGAPLIGILLLPLASSMIAVEIFEYIYLTQSTPMKWITLVALVMLIVANMMVFYLIDRQEELIFVRQRLSITEKVLKIEKQYYRDLYQTQQEVRRIRHDMKNSYSGLLGKIERNQIEDVKQEIEKMLDQVIRLETIEGGDNPALSAVLQIKKINAADLLVKIEYYVKFTSKVKVNDLDLAVLVGDALDNAVEAVEKVPVVRRTPIECSLITQEEMLIIEIKNPTVDTVDITRLKTEKPDKENHGFGLTTIRSLASRYEGELILESENNTFSLSLILQNKHFIQ